MSDRRSCPARSGVLPAKQWRAMRTHRRLAAAGRYHRRCVPGQRSAAWRAAFNVLTAHRRESIAGVKSAGRMFGRANVRRA